jgi:enoyl-CoA hydratase
MDDHVDLQITGAVARVTLSNPRKLNALTWRMYDQLIDGCTALAADSSVRVVVLRGGGGRSFAAGTDIAQFAEFDGAADGVAYEHRTADVLAAVAGLPMPVVAAVEGPAVGAGLALALCCDVVIATPDAVFGAPVARTLGNCLSPAVVGRLYASIGRARALAMLMSARTVPAEQAQRDGLVSAVVERADFEQHLDQLTTQLAQSAPLTLAAFKETDRRLLAGFDEVAADDIYRRCYGSRDFAEGVAAFLAKRPPQWHGR